MVVFSDTETRIHSEHSCLSGTARALKSRLLEWYSEGAVPPTVTLPQS